MKDKKKINVKKVKKEDFKKNYWAPFRVPSGTDQEILKGPWVSPWIREKGKKKFWIDLRFKNNVKRIPVDVKDEDDRYKIIAKMHSVSSENINIEASEKNLIIIGEGEEKSTMSGRAIKFKDKINQDKIEASYRDPTLEIDIPKKGKVVEAGGKKLKVK